MLVIKSPTPEEQSHSHTLEMSSRGTSGPCISFRAWECAEFHKTLEIPLCHWVIKHGNCVLMGKNIRKWWCFPLCHVWLPDGIPSSSSGFFRPLLWQCWSVSVGSQQAIWYLQIASHGLRLEVESTIPNQHKHRPPESLDFLWKVSSEPSFHRVYVSWKTVFRGWRFYPVTKMLLLQQPQGMLQGPGYRLVNWLTTYHVYTYHVL